MSPQSQAPTAPDTPRAGRAPAAVPPLMQRLVSELGATWVDDSSVAAWTAGGGDRVVLLAGDPVRFPEGQDVAAVLPELAKTFAGRFKLALVPLASEDAVAARYGSQRWPALLFFRDGQYITALAGMRDWEPFVAAVGLALRLPPSRAPSVGIPVVAQGAAASAGGCH